MEKVSKSRKEKYETAVANINWVKLEDFVGQAIPKDKQRCVLALAMKAALEEQLILVGLEGELKTVEVTGQMLNFTFKDGTVISEKINASMCEYIKQFDETGKWNKCAAFAARGYGSPSPKQKCDYVRE